RLTRRKSCNKTRDPVASPSVSAQDDRYREASEAYGRALGRIARAYELNADRRRDPLRRCTSRFGRASRLLGEAFNFRSPRIRPVIAIPRAASGHHPETQDEQSIF